MEHQGREHSRADQRKIEPPSIFCKEEGEITKVPNYVRGADKDEDDIEPCSRRSKQYKGYENKVNQNNQESQISIDGKYRWIHFVVKSSLFLRRNKKLHFLFGKWSFNLFTGHVPAFFGEKGL